MYIFFKLKKSKAEEIYRILIFQYILKWQMPMGESTVNVWDAKAAVISNLLPCISRNPGIIGRQKQPLY